MNFTARSTTTASETSYDRFRPIIDGAKHLNNVDDGRNNYWLKLIKRAQTIIF